jgi:hypothetical protein
MAVLELFSKYSFSITALEGLYFSMISFKSFQISKTLSSKGIFGVVEITQKSINIFSFQLFSTIAYQTVVVHGSIQITIIFFYLDM